jgi:hypothetical protein
MTSDNITQLSFDDIESKVCACCNERKPLSHFYKNGNHYFKRCKKCTKEQVLQRKAKYNARTPKYNRRYQPRSTPGIVYFILAPEINRIKIGITRQSVPERLASMQCDSPCDLQILASLEADGNKEVELHERFKKYNHHGEWFEVSEPILAFIEELKQNDT